MSRYPGIEVTRAQYATNAKEKIETSRAKFADEGKSLLMRYKSEDKVTANILEGAILS